MNKEGRITYNTHDLKDAFEAYANKRYRMPKPIKKGAKAPEHPLAKIACKMDR